LRLYPDAKEETHAVVRNLSTGGMNLASLESFPIGTTLFADLYDRRFKRIASRWARIVYAANQPGAVAFLGVCFDRPWEAVLLPNSSR
jgi:hypothetical protein